jgi:RNA polymerase sigma-70 factor (ECF subfamily)
MTGSVIDGEDTVQDALAKAVEAFAQMESIDNPEGWLFRIAHNAALDLLRRRARDPASSSGKETPTVAKAASTAEERVAVAAALRSFMHLPSSPSRPLSIAAARGFGSWRPSPTTHRR